MQEVLTYLIIFGAVSVAVLKIYKALPFQTKKTSGKCGSCATGCALKDLNGNPECPPKEHISYILFT